MHMLTGARHERRVVREEHRAVQHVQLQESIAVAEEVPALGGRLKRHSRTAAVALLGTVAPTHVSMLCPKWICVSIFCLNRCN